MSFESDEKRAANSEEFVNWHIVDTLISGRENTPDGFEEIGYSSKEISQHFEEVAKKEMAAGDPEQAQKTWIVSQAYRKSGGEDGTADAYIINPDGSKQTFRYPYEVKGDPNGNYLYRTRMDKYQNAGVLTFEITTSGGTKPGWLYGYLYKQEMNAEYYDMRKEKYGKRIGGNSYHNTPGQIVFVLCFDQDHKKPYATVTFVWDDLVPVLDKMTGGRLTGADGVECWRDHPEWKDLPVSAGETGNFWENGKKNRVWYIPLDALEEAHPRIRLIEFENETIKAYAYDGSEGKEYPIAAKIQSDENGITWELKSGDPERDHLAEKRMQYLCDHCTERPIRGYYQSIEE